jgi:23S rRNA (uracil1939-C5)-methyltransferase
LSLKYPQIPFFQTNTSGAEMLYEKVKEYAGLSGKEYVVDLYSGAGTIAIFSC